MSIPIELLRQVLPDGSEQFTVLVEGDAGRYGVEAFDTWDRELLDLRVREGWDIRIIEGRTDERTN